MDVVAVLRNRVAEILTGFAAGGLLRCAPDLTRLAVEPCRDPAWGDVTVNAALVYGSLWQGVGAGRGHVAGLSEALARTLAADVDVATVSLAKSGHLNVLFHPRRLAAAVSATLAHHPVPQSGTSVPLVRIIVTPPTPDPEDGGVLTLLRATVVADALGRLMAGTGHAVALRTPGVALGRIASARPRDPAFLLDGERQTFAGHPTNICSGDRGLGLRGGWRTADRPRASPGDRSLGLRGGWRTADRPRASRGQTATSIVVGRGPARPYASGAAPRRILVPVAACGLVPGLADPAGACAATAAEADAWRLSLLCRARTAPLAFDPAVAIDRSHAGPLFDIGYAHARAARILRVAGVGGADRDAWRGPIPEATLADLAEMPDRELLRQIALFPQAVERSVALRDPYHVASHLRDLAAAVHRQWSRSKDQPQLRFFNEEQRDLTKARLALMVASTVVLKSGLGLFGIAAPDEMP